jgi:hypothetical protein
MQELVVVSEHLIPGASPRFQVLLRDPRDRLQSPVIPIQQLFVAEGRHVLGHGPEGYVGGHTNGCGLPRTGPELSSRAARAAPVVCRNDARMVLVNWPTHIVRL